MPRYRYRARSNSGDIVRGEIDASDHRTAVLYVMELGATPLDLKEAPASGLDQGASTDVGALIDRFFGRPIPHDDLILFVRHLRSLLHAGVPIVRALRGLAEHAENVRLSHALLEIVRDLESGKSFGEAVDRQDAAFPSLLRSMMRVGEASGQLELALERMARNIAQQRLTEERVKQALRYPAFVLVAIVGALGIVNLSVIPAFSNVFARMDAELPFATRFLLGMSQAFTEYWPITLLALGIIAFTIRSYLRTEAGELALDRLKLHLPGVGPVMNKALLARFARTFSMALRSGLPVLQAVQLVAEATNNVFLSSGIRGLRAGIERGDSLYTVCKRSNLFTPLVLQMLAVGEETGEVPELLDQVADFYEGEVEEDLERLSSYIEPVVIGFIGLLVTALALGIFLPMWQMSSIA